jgi:Fe-S-cluster containining protein
MADRLCLCGSGLSYGSCCGRVASELMERIDRVRLGAYAGSTGAQRRDFCISYITHKRLALDQLSGALQAKVSGGGNSITCCEGCTPCCHVYVVASLQECDAIAYHLYQHRDVLLHFLQNYKSWRSGIEQIKNTFFEISRLQQKRLSHQDTTRDNEDFDAALIEYAGCGLPCPFLKQGSCSIYEIRPFACAGLVSTTPREWCNRESHFHRDIKLVRAELVADNDMPYFADRGGRVSLTNMPALVNEILLNGWHFLSSVPGCEWLRPASD